MRQNQSYQDGTRSGPALRKGRERHGFGLAPFNDSTLHRDKENPPKCIICDDFAVHSGSEKLADQLYCAECLERKSNPTRMTNRTGSVKVETMEYDIDMSDFGFEVDNKKLRLDSDLFGDLGFPVKKQLEVNYQRQTMVARGVKTKGIVCLSQKEESKYILRNVHVAAPQFLLNNPRIQWHPSNSTFLLKPDRLQRNVDVYTVKMVPVLREYFLRILSADGRASEYEDICQTEVFKLSPPSAMLHLLDSHLLSVKRNKRLNQSDVDFEIDQLLRSLLISPNARHFEVEQRIRLGNWIRNKLRSSLNEILSKFSIEDTESTSRVIYQCLVHGSVKEAVAIAVKSKLFNLAMVLSLFRRPNSRKCKDALAMQFLISERVFRDTPKDEYMMKIYSLLAGPTEAGGSRRDDKFLDCLVGLSWFQIMGVFLWYSAVPADGISCWANLCVDLTTNGVIQPTF